MVGVESGRSCSAEKPGPTLRRDRQVLASRVRILMRKIRNTGKLIDVSSRLDTLVERFRDQPGLVALYLYGSYDTPQQTPLSDIDLAVLFEEGDAPGPRERLLLTGVAIEALEEDDVSLTFLNRAPLPFQHEVLRTGRPLLVLDDVALADFHQRVVHRYCDFAIDYEGMRADYDEGLRRAYGSG